jgi:hypothetical protein
MRAKKSAEGIVLYCAHNEGRPESVKPRSSDYGLSTVERQTKGEKKNHRYGPSGKGGTGTGCAEEQQGVEALMEHES